MQNLEWAHGAVLCHLKVFTGLGFPMYFTREFNSVNKMKPSESAARALGEAGSAADEAELSSARQGPRSQGNSRQGAAGQAQAVLLCSEVSDLHQTYSDTICDQDADKCDLFLFHYITAKSICREKCHLHYLLLLCCHSVQTLSLALGTFCHAGARLELVAIND